MPEHFDQRIALTVDVVIFTLLDNELKVLLIRRRREPFAGMWALPGGFVQPAESLEDAARRVLYEESGATDVYLEQLYTFGHPDRDPRQRVVTVAYFALVSANRLPLDVQSPRSTERGWWPAYDPPPLAFDHADILAYALQRLRYKLEYTDCCVFEFVAQALERIRQNVGMVERQWRREFWKKPTNSNRGGIALHDSIDSAAKQL